MSKIIIVGFFIIATYTLVGISRVDSSSPYQVQVQNLDRAVRALETIARNTEKCR